MAITWNSNYELTPLGQDSPTGADDEIRLLKDSISKRMANEHETFETDNSSGAEGDDFVHKAGSAKIYYQAEAPTLRPDGATSLDSEDTGRLWIDSDTNVIYLWSGTEWVGQDTVSSAVTYTEAVTFEDTVSFESTVTQNWGVDGCLNKVATTAGTTSILWRGDSEITKSNYNNWETVRTFTASFTGGITVYYQADEQGDYRASWRVLKNGSTIQSALNKTHDYTAYSVETTVVPGDVITWQAESQLIGSAASVAHTRYCRIYVNEDITLTDWEKYFLGLTG